MHGNRFKITIPCCRDLWENRNTCSKNIHSHCLPLNLSLHEQIKPSFVFVHRPPFPQGELWQKSLSEKSECGNTNYQKLQISLSAFVYLPSSFYRYCGSYCVVISLVCVILSLAVTNAVDSFLLSDKTLVQLFLVLLRSYCYSHRKVSELFL